jgi:hypothetical protein
MDNIPYYNLSEFPIKNDLLIERINSAVILGYKMIFIDFGGYFPWSVDTIVTSQYAYSDKLIDKLVRICRKNDIKIIPVLSILTNCDFLLKDKKYKYLITEGNKFNELDILECGINKLLEKIIDDIYSLLIFSDCIFIDLPLNIINNNKTQDSFLPFINKVFKYLSDMNKNLLLGCKTEFINISTLDMPENIQLLFSRYNKLSIRKGKSYNLDINIREIMLEKEEYRVFDFCTADGFTCALDIGKYIPTYTNQYSKVHFTNVDLDDIEKFYFSINKFWYILRTCWENLNFIYRNSDPQYRVKFSRSVLSLEKIYNKLKKDSLIFLKIYAHKYQTGLLEEWMNSKMDAAFSQLNILENIARPMRDGNII